MNDRVWLTPMHEWEPYNTLTQLTLDRKTSAVQGISDEQKAHLAACLAADTGRPLLIVTHSDVRAAELEEEMGALLGAGVMRLPERPMLFYGAAAHSTEMTAKRLQVLDAFAFYKGEAPLTVIASIEGCLYPLSPLDAYKDAVLSFSLGGQYDIRALSERLVLMGYYREAMVEGPGQFSVRGGILDIFPLTTEQPFRIEFFDTEVDSIRLFDPLSQRSLEPVENADIAPAGELILSQAQRQAGITAILEKAEVFASKLSAPAARARLTEKAGRLREGLSGGMDGLDTYFPFFYPAPATVLNYLGQEGLIVIDEPRRAAERVESWDCEFAEYFKELLGRGEVLPGQAYNHIGYAAFQAQSTGYGCILMQSLIRGIEGFKLDHLCSITSRSVPTYHRSIKLLSEDLRYWKKKEYRTLLFAGRSGSARRLADALEEESIASTVRDTAEGDVEKGQILCLSAPLPKGFEYPEAGFVAVGEQELFDIRSHKTRARKRKAIESFTDLKPGDYVVHESHGIGKYVGVQTLTAGGQKRDYLYIKYSGADKLYIPTGQMDLLQPYVGPGERRPALSRLGGTEWTRAKQKARESVQKLAVDLVQLYGEREALRGHAYAEDTAWQKEFETLFPYEETPDQLRAIEDIKRDMETARVMDRLLCGDVGYGKTEVAIRAAFKAVMDGKQAAVLAPTTILVQQHLKTFSERFDSFPVSVRSLSRFNSAEEQRRVLKDLRTGDLDVVIGTHRLLGKDVGFKDLGLLIVDEEQRFGVNHKEIIKSMKSTIDVLTLTATPIPRTLHMSLSGIRDISIIETPPEDRHPVQTYVVEYNPSLVRDAILREMGRGGQTYFVYNIVQGMDRMVARLRDLVPEARIGVAHGQMSGRILERTMMDFYEQKYDVLLCSSIIENGLDVPNVNTLIVYNADHFGLSQLYQIRGRVGRSSRLAYGYFTYQRDKVLTETAEKRLQAIRDFTEFGSGFRIAMRDLEIRGAGNILGAEQHGHMSAVGYEMYCRLLQETVQAMRGEIPQEKQKTQMDLAVDAHIPNTYIDHEGQKIEVYKKIANIETRDDILAVTEELIDRFGDPPKAIINLMDIAYMVALAGRLGLVEIRHQGHLVYLYPADGTAFTGRALSEILERNRHWLKYTGQRKPVFVLKLPAALPDMALAKTKDLLEQMEEALALAAG